VRPVVGPPHYARASDLLTLKVVSESRVMWTTYVPILVFLRHSVLGLGPMYATDVRRASLRYAPYSWGGEGAGHNKFQSNLAHSIRDKRLTTWHKNYPLHLIYVCMLPCKIMSVKIVTKIT